MLTRGVRLPVLDGGCRGANACSSELGAYACSTDIPVLTRGVRFSCADEWGEVGLGKWTRWL